MVAKKLVQARWPVCKLKDHPQQRLIFGDVTDAELRALAEDMREHGQRVPVEVLPSSVVVCGHQRVRAAKLLGWTRIEVKIRYDLEAAGNGAVLEALISDNLYRQHLSPLARARSMQYLLEAAGTKYADERKELLKAQIAERLHLSARSVSRYLLVLRTPRPIQDAFDRNQITLIDAGRVALLPEDVQQELAKRIEAGEKPLDVVNARLKQRSGQDVLDRAFCRLIRCLRRETPYIADRVGDLDKARLQRCSPSFQAARTLLTEMLRHAQ